MAKNPLITDEVRRVVAGIWLEHPDWRAKEIQAGVEARLHKQNPRSKPGWPGLSAVQKELTKLRQATPDPLEKFWHLGLLQEYPHISAEAVRHIDEVQRAMRSLMRSLFAVNPDDYQLTVRLALWVARLYDLVRKHIETDDFYREHFKNTKPDDPLVLLSVAWKYAHYEQLCDLLHIPCDTSELDAALGHGLRQFFDFVSKQKAQPLREGDIIPMHQVHEEEHKQPHKMNKDWRDFVFDPDCQACRDREADGRWLALHKSAFERQRSKKISKNNKKGGKSQ